jgi:SepF-like predicted cell division protein (DUF552 family)
VSCEPINPFASIESAQEYLTLLSQAIVEARQDTEEDIQSKADLEDQRRQVEALRLVIYNLSKLEQHIKTSRRLLNDLRTLRRLLHNERMPMAA